MSGTPRIERVIGAADWPLAILLPGSASTSDFVTRAFGPALRDRGVSLATSDMPVSADPLAAFESMLDEGVRRLHPDIIGGVSVGAHVSLRYVVRTMPEVVGMVLALPAWTGPPGAVAALSSHSARAVRELGMDAVLAGMDGALPWVRHELVRAWRSYGAAGVTQLLEATAASTAPSLEDLSHAKVPAGIVAFTDDPLHPADVARQWTRLLPYASLSLVDTEHPGRGVRVLGDLAWSALAAAETRRREVSPGAPDR